MNLIFRIFSSHLVNLLSYCAMIARPRLQVLAAPHMCSALSVEDCSIVRATSGIGRCIALGRSGMVADWDLDGHRDA